MLYFIAFLFTQYDDTFVDEATSQSGTTATEFSSDVILDTDPVSTDFEDYALENFIGKSVNQLLTARHNVKHDRKKRELSLGGESFCCS